MKEIDIDRTRRELKEIGVEFDPLLEGKTATQTTVAATILPIFLEFLEERGIRCTLGHGATSPLLAGGLSEAVRACAPFLESDEGSCAPE